ncbi:hypothetical protein BJV82DRAFT_716174 [Fennellomyces sp. T-0311]|nr:hypothetical protein BJV82DRAFT_716174 [Fennellomyces sp. T-0311]
MSREALAAGLRNNMSYYGRVCQIRLYLEPETEIFEGEGTVILDVTPQTQDQYRKLTRYIHFDNWDRVFSVSWKGCPPICGFCKQEGHRQNSCEELQHVECYHCHQFGHFQKHCPVRRQRDQEDRVQRMTEEELLASFPALSNRKQQLEKMDDDDASISSAVLDSAIASAAKPPPPSSAPNNNSDLLAVEKPDIIMGDGPLGESVTRDTPDKGSLPVSKRQKIDTINDAPQTTTTTTTQNGHQAGSNSPHGGTGHLIQ